MPNNALPAGIVVLILLAGLLAGVLARKGPCRISFDEIYGKDPSMNRLTWRTNWLQFFALSPAVMAFYGGAEMLHDGAGGLNARQLIKPSRRGAA